MHSPEYLGLQQHSVGDLYPWTVMVRKNPQEQGGVVVPVHCVTQYYGPSFTFDDWAAFEAAHQRAEAWIRSVGQGDRLEYNDAMAELSALGYPESTDYQI